MTLDGFVEPPTVPYGVRVSGIEVTGAVAALKNIAAINPIIATVIRVPTIANTFKAEQLPKIIKLRAIKYNYITVL